MPTSLISPTLTLPARTATVSRTTKETDVFVSLNLDGQGKCNAATGVPFLDNMIQQIASHGLIDLEVRATGDIEIDDHHTNEDVGITIGQALAQALGDRKGIVRFGHFIAPLDEALVQVALDFSGRPPPQLWFNHSDSTGGNLRYPIGQGIFCGHCQSQSDDLTYSSIGWY